MSRMDRNKNQQQSPPPQSTVLPNNNNSNSNNDFTYHCHNLIDKILRYCSCFNNNDMNKDPVQTVHRVWSVTILTLVIYIFISILQLIHLHRNMKSANNIVLSHALLFSCLYNIMMQIICIGCLGTFIIKRFPTSFAIGFLYGILSVFIHQNIIVLLAFTSINGNNLSSKSIIQHLYTFTSFCMAVVLCIFGMVLYHYQKYIIVAPIDAKGFTTTGSRPTSPSSQQQQHHHHSTKLADPTTTVYQRYDEEEK